MKKTILGIDCGGTHTDAALLEVDEGKCLLLASAKTATLHENLPGSIAAVIKALAKERDFSKDAIDRVTLGTTLEVNALVQGKADEVGLALTAGPGLDPIHFVIGNHFCIVPGGLDHRGVETTPVYVKELEKIAVDWPKQGVAAIACVGKFSPRNPAHEDLLGKVAGNASGLPVTLGHKLSGRLNFPRRIATAYYNAAVSRLHASFLQAVEETLHSFGIHGQFRLLKADGGAIPFAVSAREPVQSILSGPAASVMGVLALWSKAAEGCSLLLDMGGTTTDLAMFLNGSPVIDRQGMQLNGRRTLVKSLAAISIGVGGDSLLQVENGEIVCGPQREGPAMAFGGANATLLDALNTLDKNPGSDRGDIAASRNGMKEFGKLAGFSALDAASLACENAMAKIAKAAYDLVENVNSRPIYTLASLKAAKDARPTVACLAGGPAQCVAKRLEPVLGMPVEIAPCPQVANAIGAGITLPTASLEVYVETGKGILTAPAIDYQEKAPRDCGLEWARNRALELLRIRLASEGIEDAKVEVVEEDLFATLDDRGRGARDIRVSVQATPGIIGSVAAACAG